MSRKTRNLNVNIRFLKLKLTQQNYDLICVISSSLEGVYLFAVLYAPLYKKCHDQRRGKDIWHMFRKIRNLIVNIRLLKLKLTQQICDPICVMSNSLEGNDTTKQLSESYNNNRATTTIEPQRSKEPTTRAKSKKSKHKQWSEMKKGFIF